MSEAVREKPYVVHHSLDGKVINGQVMNDYVSEDEHLLPLTELEKKANKTTEDTNPLLSFKDNSSDKNSSIEQNNTTIPVNESLSHNPPMFVDVKPCEEDTFTRLKKGFSGYFENAKNYLGIETTA